MAFQVMEILKILCIGLYGPIPYIPQEIFALRGSAEKALSIILSPYTKLLISVNEGNFSKLTSFQNNIFKNNKNDN